MTDRQALRENILDRAKIGAITGDDADAEAERLGLGRFSQKPDPNIFNPLDERFWTLPMVLAWIAWRTPDPVRDVWYLYCEQCWHSNGDSGASVPAETFRKGGTSSSAIGQMLEP